MVNWKDFVSGITIKDVEDIVWGFPGNRISDEATF